MTKFKTLAFYLTQLLLCLLIFEAVAYFFLLGSGNALYRTRRILQTDPALGWRARPGLDTAFEKQPLITDSRGFRLWKIPPVGSASAAPQLLTLGPSSAFGWGVRAEETYHELTAQTLHIPALNASQIGYSSVQGELLWKQLQPDRKAQDGLPRFALLAYGINDLDKFRFYGANGERDKDFFRKSPVQLGVFDRSPSLNFLSLFLILADEFSYHVNCGALASVSQRVSIPDFIATMDRLAAGLNARGFRPILINTPYYLPPFPPVRPGDINAEYTRVQELARQGHCAEALAHLQTAKQLEPERVRQDVLILNQELTRLAARRQLTLIDAYMALQDGSEPLNFVDPVHPSPRGHRIISRQILETVLQ